MKRTFAWILLTFALITVFTVPVLGQTVFGCLAGMALAAAFFFGLDGSSRSSSNRLLRSTPPGETLASNGLMNESKYDEAPAFLGPWCTILIMEGARLRMDDDFYDDGWRQLTHETRRDHPAPGG